LRLALFPDEAPRFAGAGAPARTVWVVDNDADTAALGDLTAAPCGPLL
jgi:hypothetical protein